MRWRRRGSGEVARGCCGLAVVLGGVSAVVGEGKGENNVGRDEVEAMVATARSGAPRNDKEEPPRASRAPARCGHARRRSYAAQGREPWPSGAAQGPGEANQTRNGRRRAPWWP